ncbi:MAG: transposase [Rubrobacteraceae bacterium]
MPQNVKCVIVVDPHPDSHTASAIEAPSGKVMDTIRVENTGEGLESLRRFAECYGERRWAVEGAANPFVASWVAQLLATGEEVINVPPSLTSQYRSRRSRKKNDEVDAQNAARALLANPDLPAYTPGAHQRRLQVLSRTRKRLVRELNANRMALKEIPEECPQELEILEELVSHLAEDVKRLEWLMGELVKESSPEILELQGVGPVLGATILAKVGEVSRFGSVEKFTSYCGGLTERSSGKNSRVSVNPGGNRTMNYVLHMIAQVRLRTDERSRALVERKQREGKTLRAALRVLKTYIARELYRKLKAIQRSRDLLPVGA